MKIPKKWITTTDAHEGAEQHLGISGYHQAAKAGNCQRFVRALSDPGEGDPGIWAYQDTIRPAKALNKPLHEGAHNE